MLLCVWQLQPVSMGVILVCCKWQTVCGTQVLYPWRRIFQQMFNHDRMAGALYCMWEPDRSSNHAIVTQLGARCRAAFDDYAAVQSLLINTLDVQVSFHSPQVLGLSLYEVNGSERVA